MVQLRKVVQVSCIVILVSFIVVIEGGTTRSPLGPAYSTESPCTPVTNQPDQWSKEKFPNPQLNPDRCGRDCKKSYICDPNRILLQRKADDIDLILRGIRENGICACPTSCPPGKDGFKVSIALVNKLKYDDWESTSDEKKLTDIREFADYLRIKAWNFSGSCEDDVVIFVSKSDRQLLTVMGPAATKYLNKNCTDKIFNEVKPSMTKGEYADALHMMVERYAMVFKYPETCGVPPAEADGLMGIIIGVALAGVGLILLVVFLVICGRSRRRAGGKQPPEMKHHYHVPAGNATEADKDDKDGVLDRRAGDGGTASGGGF